MKRLLRLLSLLLLASYTALAQAPEFISYQSVIRDANGHLLDNQQIGMLVSVLQDSVSGTVVYEETHSATTNANGLFSVAIGQGTLQTGTFSSIDWGASTLYYRIDIDIQGGSNYTLSSMHSFSAVPYALYSKNGLPTNGVNGTILYLDNGNWVPINQGSQGQSLTLCGGIPEWTTNGVCPIVLPRINTSIISSIGLQSALSGGTITYDGTATITARGICYSLNSNPTTADNITSDSIGIGSFTSSLNGLTNSTTYFVRAYATNSVGTAYGNEVSFTTLDPYPAGTVNCNGSPTEINDVLNPSTGKVWMDRNLGASQVSTSSTDSLSYGDLYQWGREADGHQCRASLITSTLSSSAQAGHGDFILGTSDWLALANNNLWQGADGVNNPCPSGYRLPTEAELEAEQLSWSSNNAVGAFNSPLKLSMAGARYGSDGSIGTVGSGGGYWSSTPDGVNTRRLRFTSGNGVIFSNFRANAYSVRCIKDSSFSVVGTINSLDCNFASVAGSLTEGQAANTVTARVPYSGGNGGTHNGQSVHSTGVSGLIATLSAGNFTTGNDSLIYTITGTSAAPGTAYFALSIGGQACTLSLLVTPSFPAGTVNCNGSPTEINDVLNPSTGKVWMDRNLGASQVSTSSTDSLSYGDLYQWGREADGHQCRSSSTTNTLSSTDQTGNGDFILVSGGNEDWRSGQNANLWQGVNAINNPCPSGYSIPTETELENERLSWNSSDSAGAINSALKWSLAGRRSPIDGSVVQTDTLGGYWSSTVSGLTSRNLRFRSGDASMRTSNRSVAFSIRCLKDTSSVLLGTINSLDCNSASMVGSLTVGQPANAVTAKVPYSGSNGGTHNGQSVHSTGVSGLNAFLSIGNFTSGNDSLTYTITGTPATSGTASFALSIGGQVCTLSLTIAAAAPSYPAGTVHCSATPAAIVDVTNPATGKIWMDRNLGASQVATSSTDAASYGDLYQWGRGADGHQCRTSSIISNIRSSTDQPGHGDFINITGDWRSPQNTNLWQGVNGVNNPCPSSYRLPTESELNAERLSLTSSGAAGAFASPLKLPLAGYRHLGSLQGVGADGSYWSNTVSGTISSGLGFHSQINTIVGIFGQMRSLGHSVRCIKDTNSVLIGTINSFDCNSTSISGNLTAGQPASSVTAKVPYSGGNGGTHIGQSVNSTGVIGLTAFLSVGNFTSGNDSLYYTITGTPPTPSGTASFALSIGGQVCTLSLPIASPSYPSGTVHCSATPTAIVDVTNPATGKIWMDRNLGASQVAISSTDAASYGDLYQWGRGADGHQCRNSNTTITLTSSDQPGHGDYIATSNFTNDWRSPLNNNLWQGVNGVNNPCPSGYRLPTETELNAERTSWSSNNAAGALASPLKLPLAGIRTFYYGSLYNVGAGSSYWSNTIIGAYSRNLYSAITGADLENQSRANGFSVRCIKD